MKLYDKYIKTHFGDMHSENQIKSDYALMDKYYKKNYLKYLPKDKNSKILDLGCGMGHFLYFLNHEGYQNYEGIDLSSECINFCIKNRLGNKRNLINKDAIQYLKVNSRKKYSVIVMNDVIEHIQKDKIIFSLSILRTKLTKKGVIIIKVVNSANPVTGSSSRYYDFTHTVGFVEESLRQVLRLSGYGKIKIIPQDIWVFNPLINVIGHIFQGIFNLIFRSLFLLYGRKTTKIFTKDIIAVAYKD